MAISFPSSTFIYAGKKYNFTAYLMSYDFKTNLALDNNAIQMFEYVNSLNSLCMTGSLEYVDNVGKVEHFVESQFCTMRIAFAQIDQKFDKDFAIEKIDKKKCFNHEFIVDNIEIVDRQNDYIKYKFWLKSKNYLNLIKTVQYSNYDSQPIPILSILTTCMSEAVDDKSDDSLYRIDAESLAKALDNVKISYTTGRNDNAFSISKHLMNKLFYFKNRIESIVFIWYDEVERYYKFFNISQLNDVKAAKSVMLSLFKTNEEKMMYQLQCDLGTVVKFSKSSMLKLFRDKHMSTYDYNTNSLSTVDINTQSIASTLNNRSNSLDESYKDKYTGLDTHMLWNDEYGAYWNNEFTTYSDMCRELTEDNAMIVNADGIINTQPTTVFALAIPEDPNNVSSEDQQAYKDAKQRYDKLQGLWIVSKVRHFISPAKSTFRQNIVMFKNFT